MEAPLIIPDTELLESTFLTTHDNPYDPMTNYDQWLKYDHDNQYYTDEYLARVANLDVESEGPEADYQLELAKIEILNNDMLNIYKLV